MSITVNAASTSSQHGTATPTALTLAAAVTAGDLVCLFVVNNKTGSYQSVSTVTSSPSLTWTKRWRQENDQTSGGTQKCNQELWTAPHPSGNGASGLAITVTFSASTDAICLGAWSITGLVNAAPFDPNGALPATNVNTSSTGAAVSVSGVATTNTDTAIFGFFGNGSSGFPTAQATWTGIIGFDNAGGTNFGSMFVEYKLFSSPQSSFTITPSGGNQGLWQFTADAFTSDVVGFKYNQFISVGF
jgi:hypothetical protein